VARNVEMFSNILVGPVPVEILIVFDDVDLAGTLFTILLVYLLTRVCVTNET
jgi:hypothetical protein